MKTSTFCIDFEDLRLILLYSPLDINLPSPVISTITVSWQFKLGTNCPSVLDNCGFTKSDPLRGRAGSMLLSCHLVAQVAISMSW